MNNQMNNNDDEKLLADEIRQEIIRHETKQGSFSVDIGNKIRDKYVRKTQDPWIILEIYRRCESMNLFLAVDNKCSAEDMQSIFENRKKLGFSSGDDRFNAYFTMISALRKCQLNKEANLLANELVDFYSNQLNENQHLLKNSKKIRDGKRL